MKQSDDAISSVPASQEYAHRLQWDIGTAYDLFISLIVLLMPEKFGLRPSWAAGVRSRLPHAERKLLEDIQPFIWVPFEFTYTLPAPKDAACAIRQLGQMSPEDRVKTMLTNTYLPGEFSTLVERVIEQRSWGEVDLDAMKSATKTLDLPGRSKSLPILLDWLSRPVEFGELYLSALESYHQVFFAEEEQRFNRFLPDVVKKAQALAAKLPIHELLEELSQGVHFQALLKTREIILVPAFWNTPLVFHAEIPVDKMIFIYGARPANAALIPGEQVPEALLRVLKALADPTRLNIIRYLSDEDLTPAELARRLRLRAPTITHHLNQLRLAGLVHITLEAGGERHYRARLGASQNALTNLQEFIGSDAFDKDINR